MRSRLVAGAVALGVGIATLTVPVTAAHAAPPPVTVVVGPEALLSGSTGIRLTKEYETVSGAPGVRSSADHVFVAGPTDLDALAAHGGSSVALFTGGAGTPTPGKEYVGRWFDPATTAATSLTAVSFRTLSPSSGTGLAPYLSVELYDPTLSASPSYVNLIWTPGEGGNPAVTPGRWQQLDATGSWSTTSNSIGVTRNSPAYTLDQLVTAALAANPKLGLLRANVSWGDTAANYVNQTAYLDDLSLTLDGVTTTYAFDAPSSSCVAPAGGFVRPSDLTDPAQWAVHTEYQPTIASTATAGIVSGPAGATGAQSLQLSSGAGTAPTPATGRGFAGKVFVDRALPGCTVADLTSLGYRAYTSAANAGYAPYLNIDVALPGSNAVPAPSTILVWSPGESGNPAPVANAWTTYTPTTGSGWRVTRAITGAGGTLTPGLYYSWAQVQAAIGSATLTRGVEIVAGDSTYQSVPGTGWSTKTLQVDALSIGVGGTTSSFDFGGFGACPMTFDYVAQVATMTADCDTSTTLWVPDGWTLDGAGHAVRGLETPSTAFTGAIVQNAGVLMNLRHLTVTTNKAVWDNAGKNSGGDLVGVRFLAASGTLSDVTVDGVSHGNGVQEGKGLLVDNRTGSHSVQVSADHVSVVNYQKNGVDVRGAGATLELRDSTIGAAATPNGAPIDTQTAANSLVIAYGATAVVTGSHITGNDWDGTGDVPNTRDWSATGVLLYQAGPSVIAGNVIDGAGTDVGIDVAESAATITCNVVTRTDDQPGRLDVWSTGIAVETGSSASLAANTVSGFRTPINGAVQAGSGGCTPGTVALLATPTGTSTGTLLWSPVTPPPASAPITGWELVVDGAVQTLPASTTTLPLSGLAPGSTHAVSVRALDADGAGPWSTQSFTTVDIDRRTPGTPTVTPHDVTTRTAGVDWGYVLPSGMAPITSWEVAVDGVVRTLTTTTLSLTGLAPGSTHGVSVRGINSNGAGPWTAATFTTTAIDAPPAVSGLVVGSITRTSALASWSASAVTGDGAVDSYEVTVDSVPSVVPAATLSRSLTGLLPGTAHTVVLRAHNEAGWSNPVSAAFTTSDLDRRTPGAPALSVGDPDGDGTVPMAWTPNAGDSTDFPVQHWVVTVDGTDEASLAPGTHAYAVVGLDAGRHTFAVRGVNALGAGVFAAQVVMLESSNASLPISVLTPSASLVPAGTLVTLYGSFGLDGIPATDAVVTLWQQAGGTWVLLGSTVTDANGGAIFRVRPTTATTYRALVSGLPSAYATVAVRHVVTTKLLVTAAKSKGKVKLSLVRVQVGVTPTAAGATVRLQRLVGRSWKPVSSGRLTAASGAILAIGTVKAVAGKYRVVVSATRVSPALVSPILTVSVKARR